MGPKAAYGCRSAGHLPWREKLFLGPSEGAVAGRRQQLLLRALAEGPTLPSSVFPGSCRPANIAALHCQKLSSAYVSRGWAGVLFPLCCGPTGSTFVAVPFALPFLQSVHHHLRAAAVAHLARSGWARGQNATHAL